MAGRGRRKEGRRDAGWREGGWVRKRGRGEASKSRKRRGEKGEAL